MPEDEDGELLERDIGEDCDDPDEWRDVCDDPVWGEDDDG